MRNAEHLSTGNITRDADLAEGVEQSICGPTEQVVEGDGQVVGAHLGRQACQQTSIGACAWELQPELTLQATEGGLDRVAQAVEPLHRALAVRTLRVIALEQHRGSPIGAPVSPPGCTLKAEIGQRRSSERRSSAQPPTHGPARAVALAAVVVSWAKHVRQGCGGRRWGTRLLPPPDKSFRQPMLFGTGWSDHPARHP